jgi:tetraacyldisaccharide 4'-kinase
VGNLTVGGTGKTPFVRFLAAWLGDRGLRVAVLTRGYGGTRGLAGAAVVSLGGPAPDVRAVGDEALLLRPAAGGVVVGKDRVSSARFARDTLHADVIVMDDSLQYRRLRKDLEVVLIDATRPFGNGLLLPLGILREPCGALRRANLVVLSRADEVAEADLGSIEARVRESGYRGEIVRAAHRPSRLNRFPEGEARSLESLRGQSVIAFCGIGNPASFRHALGRLGANVLRLAVYPDHYRFTSQDLRHLGSLASREQADLLVTTEKDAVRIPGGWSSRPDLLVLRVDVEILRGAEDLERVLAPLVARARNSRRQKE